MRKGGGFDAPYQLSTHARSTCGKRSAKAIAFGEKAVEKAGGRTEAGKKGGGEPLGGSRQTSSNHAGFGNVGEIVEMRHLVVCQISNDGWEGGEASTGSTRASRVVFGALAEDECFRPFHAVFDEGVENNTRGRVCSPRFLHTRCIRQNHFYRPLARMP